MMARKVQENVRALDKGGGGARSRWKQHARSTTEDQAIQTALWIQRRGVMIATMINTCDSRSRGEGS